ncbi:MAG: DinB family protein [Desulfobacteraceae bacterium]|jgi:hypothetical protein
MDRRSDIIDALQDGLEQSLGFFGALTPQQLATEVYQDGPRWRAIQVVAHFITIERSMHWLFRNMLDGGEGSPADFDPDRFNRKQVPKIDHLPLGTLLAQFKEVRTETIEIVRKMSDADLDRTGRHAFHGHGTLERFIRWAYQHARLHEDDIRKAIGK